MTEIVGYKSNTFKPVTGDKDLSEGTTFNLHQNYSVAPNGVMFDVSETGGSGWSSWFDGDSGADEQGEDSGQTATVSHYEDGQWVETTSGQVYLETAHDVTGSDGSQLTLYKVEIDGEHQGWVGDGELDPDVTYTVTSVYDVTYHTAPKYSELEDANFDGDSDDGGGTLSNVWGDVLDLDLDNDLTGTSQDDTIAAGSGNDRVVGGEGNDTISGDTGNDHLQGDGEGTTTVTIDASNYADTSNGYTVTAKNISGGQQTAEDVSNIAVHSGMGFFGASGSISDSDSGVTQQVGYDKASGKSEELIVDLDAPTTEATFDFAHLYTSYYGEVGHWAIYNNGVLVAESSFTEQGSGSGNGTIDLSGHGPFDKIVISAELQSDGTDGSDFGLTGITFEASGIAGDDSIDGGDGHDTILGGGGHDTLAGGDGDDYIEGGEGDDLLTTGLGNDTLIGGTGDDTLMNSAGDDSLVGGEGNDSIVATEGNDTLEGGTGNDTMDGGADNDSLEGGEGNDSLMGGTGDDSLWGGDGDDYLEGGEGNDFLSTGLGNDTLIGGEGDDTLQNSDGDDSLVGGSGNDSIIATGGDDTLEGGTGDDTMDGGADNDSLEGGSGRDLMKGGTGDDEIHGGDDQDTVVFEDGFGNDTVTGGEGGTDEDVLDFSNVTGPVTVAYTSDEAGFVTDGTDTVTFSEIEKVITTDHADVVDASGQTGSTGIDVDTGDGDDSITGGDNDDTINAGSGADQVDGGAGDDSVQGGDGDDDLRGGNGDDTLEGGAGNDTLTAGNNSGAGDSLSGGDGDDVLTDSYWNSTLDGGDGSDHFNVGYGTATVIGGEGGTDEDTLSFATADDAVKIKFTGDEAGTYSDSDGDSGSFTGIEALELTSENDSVNANDDSTGLDIDAGAGHDSILGGKGADSITGGSGDDTIDGGAGDDTIEGGTGDDSLSGGDGDDTFEYTAGDGDDTITDFNFGNSGTLSDGDSGNNDFIDLSTFYDDLWELHADQADDGILNQSNDGVDGADYSDNDSFGSGSLTFSGASADGSSFTQENTGVVCFTAGTRIMTPRGEVAIDALNVGDLVSTLDNGPQPIRWIGRRQIGAAELGADVRLRPVLIAKGMLGAKRDLLVSRQHAVLADRDHLTRAVHLTSVPGLAARIANGRKHVTYIHLMFDTHQIVFAEGVPSESFYPGRMALQMLGPASRRELADTFPEFSTSTSFEDIISLYGPRVRPLRKRLKMTA